MNAFHAFRPGGMNWLKFKCRFPPILLLSGLAVLNFEIPLERQLLNIYKYNQNKKTTFVTQKINKSNSLRMSKIEMLPLIFCTLLLFTRTLYKILIL